MTKIERSGILVLVAALLVGGCQDLNVPNENNPDREIALAQPDAVESLAANSFPIWFGLLHQSSVVTLLAPSVADEMTTTFSFDSRCNPTSELASEPRRPFNNDPVSCTHDWPEVLWEDTYELVANTIDVLRAIEHNKLQILIEDEDHTDQVRAWAKLWQGISLGYVGLTFDQGWIATEDTPSDVIDNAVEMLPLRPYDEVVAAAVDILQEAADLALSLDPFEIPIEWAQLPVPMDNQRLAQVAHSFAARLIAMNGRTPEERAAADWNAVLSHLDQGITSDLTVVLGSASSERSNYLRYISRSSSTLEYADYRLIGPADISGNYQTWFNAPYGQKDKFLITTPDRRITGDTPTSNGKYFRYRSSDPFDVTQGPYFGSYYQWYRIKGRYNSGEWGYLTLTEMNLLRAEALFHTGDAAGAAQLINLTRVENGELPPITAAGVPAAADCAPRASSSGACGSLLQALEHERRMELSGLDNMFTYLDRRGFGSLASGTLLHLPIPGEQQAILRIPLYTFGGNLPWSAP